MALQRKRCAEIGKPDGFRPVSRLVDPIGIPMDPPGMNPYEASTAGLYFVHNQFNLRHNSKQSTEVILSYRKADGQNKLTPSFVLIYHLKSMLQDPLFYSYSVAQRKELI